ncbi:MAG: hypothetical protein ACI31G_05115 [Bacilli bacterium]
MKQSRLAVARDEYLTKLNFLHYDPSNDNLTNEEIDLKEKEIINEMVNALTVDEEETIKFYSDEGNLRYFYRLLPMVQETLKSEKLKETTKNLLDKISKGEGKFKIMEESLAEDINNFIN